MNAIPTPLEAHRFQRYSGSSEIATYLRALCAAAGDIAALEVVGRSAQGRHEILALLCGVSEVARVAAGKLRVFLVGSQHGASEAAGGEALLLLAREILCGDLRELLAAFEVVIVPNANPDGRDADSSRNGNGVNINRDFVLLSQPESRALDAAVQRYAPAVVLDAHESAVLKRRTLGREGYLTTFEAQFDVANTPAIPRRVREMACDTLLPRLLAAVETRGLRAQRYIREITSLDQPITHGGPTLRKFRNKSGVRGPLTVLLETPMEPKTERYPSFRNIEQRVARQLLCQRAFLECVRAEAAAIDAAVARAARDPDDGMLPLNGVYVREPATATLTIPLRERATGAVVPTVFADHRTLVAEDPIEIPECYYVSAHHEVFSALLARHRIPFEVLERDAHVRVVSDVFAGGADDVATACSRVDQYTQAVRFTSGALRVPLVGVSRRLVPLLLDPRSSSSVFRYLPYLRLLPRGAPFFVHRADAA